MKRTLVVAVVALAVGACADEDAATETREGVRAAQPDAPPVSPRVTNVGAACERKHGCQGEEPECMTRSSTYAIYGGGYCTASCASDLQCGPGGLCPVGEAEQLAPDYDFTISWPRRCFRSCTPGPESGCRSGYRCLSLAHAYQRPSAPAPMQRPVCIPGDAHPDLEAHQKDERDAGAPGAEPPDASPFSFSDKSTAAHEAVSSALTGVSLDAGR